MNVWKRMAPFDRRELYYFNTTKEFDAAKLAAKLYTMIQEELERQCKREVLFLCIGTDRSTGDSLGPLIGHKLQERQLTNVRILGTLNRPVHAMNLEEYVRILEKGYPNHLVVAIDASVGKTDHVGCITLGKGSLKPGLGVSKELKEVGDIFITGIVSSCGNYDPLMLQSIRLSVVMHLADCISDSICLVEKLWDSMALV